MTLKYLLAEKRKDRDRNVFGTDSIAVSRKCSAASGADFVQPRNLIEFATERDAHNSTVDDSRLEPTPVLSNNLSGSWDLNDGQRSPLGQSMTFLLTQKRPYRLSLLISPSSSTR